MESKMRGRPVKGRKAKSRTKAAKTTRGRSSKSKKAPKKKAPKKKASKSRKTSKAVAKRTTTARKRAAPARKKAGRKTGSRTSGRGRVRKEVLGEGNYTAAREFRREQTQFVRRTKGKIPEMGEQAAAALEGGEGTELLREAEESARSHSAGEDH
jgi:hypothetical protein